MLNNYIINIHEKEKWKKLISHEKCIMASWEYCKIIQDRTGNTAQLFVVECDDTVVVYPILLREIKENELGKYKGQKYWDINTPEYTGPICINEGERHQELGLMFQNMFHDYCMKIGVIAEFAHLNPWHHDRNSLDDKYIETDREIVYIDLTWGEQGLWGRSLTSDTRRQLKQAINAGVKVKRAETETDVLEFHRLYSSTMARRNALKKYYFPEEYFLAFYNTMSNAAAFIIAEYQNKVVAGGLYLQDAKDVYWHLSVMDMEYSHVRPMNACHYEAILWAIRSGKQRLLCGGGYQPDDGVFKFKAGFSPLRVPFKVYKKIHDIEKYEYLSKKWKEQNNDRCLVKNYFPVYRSGNG